MASMKFWTKSKRRLMYLIAQELGVGELHGTFSMPELALLSLWRAGFLEVSLTSKGRRALERDLDVDIDGEPHDLLQTKPSKDTE